MSTPLDESRRRVLRAMALAIEAGVWPVGQDAFCRCGAARELYGWQGRSGPGLLRCPRCDRA